MSYQPVDQADREGRWPMSPGQESESAAAANRSMCRALAGLLVGGLVLAACTQSVPAPVVYKGSTPSSGALAPAQPGPPGQTATVRRGESLYDIAKRTDVPIRRLIEANDLSPPYRLRTGQRLHVPAARFHTVVSGDTVYGVSRRYAVDMYSLVRANRLSKPYTITVGQRLRLPVPANSARAGRGSAKVAALATGAPARRRESEGARGRPGGQGFAWPVEGRVVSSFGPKPGGLHNDGINIAVAAGIEVRAAGDGVVAYAGNELRGFGYLLLIRHDGGWITAYAHNDTLLVGRGQKVRRGEPVARAGSTGSVATPQLHFEIRKGVTVVNPLRHLPKRISSAAPVSRSAPRAVQPSLG